MFKLITFLGLISSMVYIGYCCSCLPRTQKDNEQLFCNSDFAAIVRILKKPSKCLNPMGFDDDICYPIRIQNVLRGFGNPTQLETAPDSARCGLDNLFPGVYFLVVNLTDPTTIQANLCGLIIDVTKLDKRRETVKLYNSIECC